MIDYVKFEIKGEDAENLLRISEFYKLLRPDVYRKTGKEMKNLLVGNDGNFKVKKVRDKVTGIEYLKVGFSIHTYASGGINYDDLSFNRLAIALFDFQTKYKVNLDRAVIHFMEFGVNLTVPEPPLKLLKCFLSYRNTPFSRPEDSGKEGLYMTRCKKSRFNIKVYDKGIKSDLLIPRLRYELQVKRMKYLESTGIKTMVDLLDREKIRALGKILENTFSQILMVNPNIDETKLTLEHVEFIKQAKDNRFWDSMKETDRKNQLALKDELRRLNREFGFPDVQSNLQKKIRIKWKYLFYYVGKERILKTLRIPLSNKTNYDAPAFRWENIRKRSVKGTPLR